MALRLILSSLLCIVFMQGAYAEDPAIRAEAEKIYGSVLSPYCPGRLLSHCPSGAADKLKKRIYQELEQGKSSTAVVEDLYIEFGDEIRAAPTFSGFGIVGWVVPGIFLLLGLGIIVRFVKKSNSN